MDDHRGRRRDPPAGLTAAAARAAVAANPSGARSAGDDAPLVRALPPWIEPILRPAGLELLVGENAGVISEAWAEGSPGVAGVTFACPQCGGTLEPDGRVRMIECPYCGSGVGLPESVWLRLHPPRTATIWVLYDPRARIIDLEDVRDVVGDADGNLYVVGRSEATGEFGLFVLDPTLRLQWSAPLSDEHSWRVSLRVDGEPLVWWHETGTFVVRDLARRGSAGHEVRIEVPDLVRVFDVDPTGRIIGVKHEPRGRTHGHYSLVRLHADGTVSPWWASKPESLGSRLMGMFAHRPRVEWASLGPRPGEIPSSAEVVAGADGSIALFDASCFVVYGPDGDGPLGGDGVVQRVDKVRRCGNGWLVLDREGDAALSFVGPDARFQTLLPASERDRIESGWPARAAEGRIAVRSELAFHLYDETGGLMFETWRAREGG